LQHGRQLGLEGLVLEIFELDLDALVFGLIVGGDLLPELLRAALSLTCRIVTLASAQAAPAPEASKADARTSLRNDMVSSRENSKARTLAIFYPLCGLNLS